MENALHFYFFLGSENSKIFSIAAETPKMPIFPYALKWKLTVSKTKPVKQKILSKDEKNIKTPL